MYHGTDEEAACSIENGWFRPSTDGMLGPGIYLSRDIKKAKNYGCVVLKCNAAVGKVKKIDCQNHPLQYTWAHQL